MTQALETCIGLALMFLLCSLLVSALLEFISAVFNRRARLLKQALNALVGDADKILKHEILKGMTQGEKLPSYIDPRVFAMVLLDLQSLPPVPVNSLPPGKAIINKLNTMPVVQVAATPAAQQVALQQQIELWFQEAMNRWEGSYKRMSQTISLGICIVMVPLLNINTVTVAQTLWTSPALRATMLANATEVVAEETQQGKQAKPADETAEDEQVKLTKDQLQALGLPIGWDSTRPFKDIWLSSLPGWLISILAISAGSAFWFDALNRLVNLRLTGTPPKDMTREKQ